MDNKNRRLLQHCQQDIVNDLDVTDILDELFTKNAISRDEFDHIFDLKNRIDRTRYLLDTLIQNGTNSSFETFVDTLSKDYNWLSNKLTVDNNDQMINNSFEDSLSKGDVPRLPDRHVRRDVEASVATALKHLTRHKILALHGMPGSGKTCVAISVLRDHPELITNNFDGVTFWLNFGNCKTDDDIIVQQNILLRKASLIYKNNSHMNSTISMSSIGSNMDNHYDLPSLEVRDKLKSQFSEQPLKESLLVLDELNDKKCMEAFDIGCKILVTTRDADVVSNFKPKIITIANDFKERESLELFASCLEMNVQNLPWQAKKLHELCKGSTFHIALIGAQLAENKERFNHDSKVWNEYLKKLEKKEFLFFSKTQDNPMKTIEVCINSLDKTILPLFKMLTVLPDNVKISAKVLSKLWNKEVSKVEQILKILRSKSLIIEYFIREKNNYMYEIHDLIMNYLRTCTGKDDSMKLHSDFLKSYNYETARPPVEITDDGYIAFYIGYHVLNTRNMNNKWVLFKKLYLDLKFLGNKVKLTGPADVMLDLQKYESYIVENDVDRNLLHSIKAYLCTHGTDLFHYPFTDIVQSILQHESKGILFSKASEMAQSSCVNNELYFDFLHEQNVEEIKHSTIDVKENITSVCFLGNYVLVGTYSGAVKFFHIPTNKLKKELQGTDSPIKWIGVCPTKPHIVASLAQNGIIKLSTVFIDDVEQDDDDIIEEEPEEPCNNNYPTFVDIYPSSDLFINCRWTNDEEILITHTSKKIIFYRINGDVLKTVDSFDRGTELLCCVPSNNDKYVIAATRSSVYKVEMIDSISHEIVVSFEESDNVLDIITVPGTNKIITLKINEILEHEYKINTNSIMNNCNTCRCRRIIASNEVIDNLKFISIAVNKIGTLLFVSTDDIRVLVVDLKTYSHVIDLDNRRGNVKAMAVSEVFGWDEFVPGSDVLLTGTDPTENSAKVWYIDASYISQTAQKNGKVRLTTKFDVSFLKSLSPQTPSSSTPNSGTESTLSTPKRHQSFGNHKDVTKRLLKNTMSLDRLALKPLNLKGICNNDEGAIQPLLAVVDDKNNIQVMRGRKTLTEIITKSEEHITTIKISPCNQHIVYGLRSGNVKKYTLRTKECTTIMDLYSPVQYLNFVNASLLVVAAKNRSLMAYRFTEDGVWKPEMLQRGTTSLGSQELLNDLHGVKKKNSQPDQLTSSNSDTSLSSNDRLFRNGDIKAIHKGSVMVNCFWVPEVGLITVEHNATIKLWDKDLNMSCVLNARQQRMNINCAAFQNNVLVICDDNNKGFQTFELREGTHMELHTIQEYKLDIVIVSCTLTADGNILALGLETGLVVVWNVKGKRQIKSLSHHNSKVHWCSFSPVPTRLCRNYVQSPIGPIQPQDGEDEQPPLVLVTMASEIVWWNISLIMKIRANDSIWRNRLNVVTPLTSPLEVGNNIGSPCNNVDRGSNTNFFFGDGLCVSQDCWKAIWKGKKCKEGSKKREILACIKLSGMNATKLCHDAQFSCFVTVDNPGHIHIMNIMKPNT